MKNRLIYSVLFIISFAFSSQAQRKSFSIGNLEAEPITIDYVRDTESVFYIPKSKRNLNVRLFFYAEIDDSIIIYLNSKYEFSSPVRTKPNSSGLTFSVQFQLKDISRFNFIQVVLKKRNIFFELPIDPRYAFIYLYNTNRPKDNFYSWSANYSNIFPAEGLDIKK
jgi:hypothetical protein